MSMLLTVLCIARSVVMPEPPLPGHENMLVAAELTTEIFCPRMILKQQPGNLDIRNSGETSEPDEHDDRGLPVFCSLLLKMPALISWILSFLFLPGVPGNL
ncbi:hypothetical protein SEEGA711_02129 [Salmonella enterica subsp. enterica serovar Gaminara str. ATCC BAA-711]|nr:hypothetical protein SEEGA711_02129 [Salmonella enterica subsp. enterica serovar Gaminara str. ATCC BAA-711]MIT32451.1 hypothetical protein [Salmonella enterica]